MEAAAGTFAADPAGGGSFVAGGAVAGVPRFWRYATKAPISFAGRFVAAIPPAFILLLGSSKRLVSAAGVVALLNFDNSGALLVPIPPGP